LSNISVPFRKTIFLPPAGPRHSFTRKRWRNTGANRAYGSGGGVCRLTRKQPAGVICELVEDGEEVEGFAERGRKAE
jgi:hypothetical protein